MAVAVFLIFLVFLIVVIIVIVCVRKKKRESKYPLYYSVYDCFLVWKYSSMYNYTSHSGLTNNFDIV